MSGLSEFFNRRRRFFLFLLLYPVLPVAIVVNLSWLLRWPQELSDTLFFLLMVPEGVAFVAFAVFVHRCRCPSCGGLFFLRKTWIGLTYGNPFTRKCLNCGMPNSTDDGDTQRQRSEENQ